MSLANDEPARNAPARHFGARVSADRQSLELDDAAQAHWQSGPILGADSLAVGPLLMSPAAGRHLAEWIFEQVRAGDRAGYWLLRGLRGEWFRIGVDGGQATIEYKSWDEEQGERALAHGFRNQMNAVRTNADLLKLLAERHGHDRLIEPIERIIRNTGEMADTFEVIASRSAHNRVGSCDVLAGIRAVLERTAWAGRVGIEGTVQRQTPVGYCAVVAHLLLEWASLDLAAGHDCTFVAGLSEDGSALQLAAPVIGSWVEALARRRRPDPRRTSAERWPVGVLRTLETGGGVWGAPGAGYASIALPA